MAGKNITETARQMLSAFLPEHGYELWSIEFVKTGKDFYLNVYIDSEKGVTTDDCEVVSRYLESRLDEEDPIDTNYYLVVSSPGMDRMLLTDAHFERYSGTPVDVSLYKGFEGKKIWSGALGVRTEDTLTITDENGCERSIPRALVSKVRLQVIF
ncbi:MAG: ribosome maturation factor RimP [Clostridiales Family XIII bacterium]|nr:ribosome maturation factor RimP [Clostridiales Family XIII bacterium]